MSYPEPIYHGTTGEKTATYRPNGTGADWTYANGNTVHYLATHKTTGGLFGLYRWEMGPSPSGPPAHFHKTITESFYVLTGTIKIFNGTEWIDTEPGDFVHVPAGGIHGFRNESGAPASMLLHFSPGAPREGYFEGLPDLGEMTEQEQVDFFLEHDNYWL